MEEPQKQVIDHHPIIRANPASSAVGSDSTIPVFEQVTANPCARKAYLVFGSHCNPHIKLHIVKTHETNNLFIINWNAGLHYNVQLFQ